MHGAALVGLLLTTAAVSAQNAEGDTYLPFKCDFENGLCGLTNDPQAGRSGTNVYDWNSKTGPTGSSGTGPSSGEGGSSKYVYFESSDPVKAYVGTASLTTPTFTIKGVRSVCVRFSYHMYGTHVGDLSLMYGTESSSETEWSKSGNLGNEWMTANVTVPLNLNFVRHWFTWVAVKGSGYQGDIGLDSIYITTGTCDDSTAMDHCMSNPCLNGGTCINGNRNYSCYCSAGYTGPECQNRSGGSGGQTPAQLRIATFNFSTGIDDGVFQDKSDDRDWSFARGPTGSSGTGPNGGHGGSGDGYIYFESSSPVSDGDLARFTSNRLNSSGEMCVRFWYAMNGQHLKTGKLALYVLAGDDFKYAPVEYYFGISGNLGVAWIEAEVDVKVPHADSRVGFEATRGNGYQSDIAVDDISITTGKCNGSTTSGSVDSKPSNDSSVMCNWGNMVWSRCTKTNSGWDNCTWYNDHMTNPAKSAEHWGQCVAENGTFGSCVWKNGTMQPCKWGKAAMHWAHCEWNNGLQSICHWKNNNWGGCSWLGQNRSPGNSDIQYSYNSDTMDTNKGGSSGWESNRGDGGDSMQDEWGKCTFSIGNWGYCSWDHGMLKGCHLGQMTTGTELHKYCDFGNSTTLSCSMKNGTWNNCTVDSNMNSTSTYAPNDWSICSISNGTWGFCNSKNKTCRWGKSDKMEKAKNSTVLCSWGNMTWSECQWGNGNWSGCQWHNKGNSSSNKTLEHWGQCTMDNEMWGSCKWANGSIRECYWNDGKNNNLQWAMCAWDGGVDTHCQEKNGVWMCDWGNKTMGNKSMAYTSMPIGMKNQSDHWGKCSFSFGVWAKCKAGFTSIEECHMGKGKGLTEATVKYCDWGKNMTTKCVRDMHGWKCDNSSMSNMNATNGNWSQCHMDNGTWGWCTLGNGKPWCMWGKKHRMSHSKSVMCSWHSKVWSRCKWSDEKGWRSCSWHNRKMMNNSGADMSGNGTMMNGTMIMMNGTMMNGTMNEPHWGQCVKDDGVFGTCTFANGSMGACNWTTDPKESQPHKWARCEWSDNTISTCHYKNNSYRGCKGGGIDGSWGHCQMSTGFWAQCQLLNGSLHNCTWGDMKMKNESDDWHFCFWDRGYSTECFGTNKSNCHSVAIPNSAAMDPSGWGMCASSMGSWGFCNKDTNTCYQGTMNKTTVLCSWGPGVWSNCAWSKKGWDKCSWYKNPNKLSDKNSSATHWGQCIRDDKVWGTCLFANGSMGACNWTTDPIESKPRKWARCQWQDDSSSICFEGDTGFGDCSSRGVGIGKCIFSTGVWKKCMMNGRTLANCTGNNDDSFRKDCFWDNGYSTTCHDSQGKNCTHSTTMRQTPAAPVWGMCFTSNNKWGWCNKVKMECYFGSYNANVTGRLANDMTEMRIHPAMSVVKANYPAKLLCNILEVASSKDKPIISWHFPNGTKIHNTGLRGFRQQDRFQTKTLYSVDSGEYMSSLAMSLTNPEMSGFFECHAAYNGKNVIAKTLVLIEVCGTGSYKCGDNECIPNRWVCDGRADCSNLSDEINCI